MKITIIAVGKLKEKYLRDAADEYIKRLGRYCSLEIIEVSDEKVPEKRSINVENGIKEKEGERILKHISQDAHVISLEIDGKQLDSEAFASTVEQLFVRGISHIQFVIGGSVGLCDQVRTRADFALSFSKMTFPHQIMRVLLLEQVYRSFRIISGEPYHK